ADTAGTTSRGCGVSMRELRIGIDEAGRHREVSRHELLVLGAEGLELIARDAIKRIGSDVFGQHGIVVTLPHRPRVEGIAVFDRLAFACIAVTACRPTVTGPQPLLVGTPVVRLATAARLTAASGSR